MQQRVQSFMGCFMADETIATTYSMWSSTYDTDRNLTRDLDAQVTARFVGGLHFGSLLEIGCGTGKNTQVLAQHSGHVLALDVSPGMLAVARQKVQMPHVQFQQADLAQPWPCADAAVDAVVGNLVLEHIADLGFVFGEAARVLRPGGTLFLCELHPFKQYLGSKARFQHGDTTHVLPAFVHHTSQFVAAGSAAGLRLRDLGEWWHQEDTEAPPRLISFVFDRPTPTR